jgi:hypothetical protein
LPSSTASIVSLPFPSIELPPASRARLNSTLTAFMLPGEQPSRDVPAGTEVMVVAGPRERGNETWYEIDYPLGTGELLFPWVRISDPSVLSPIAADCPVDQAQALAMPAWDRLTCVGSGTFEVVGEVSHCQGGVVAAVPEWLAYSCWAVSVDGGGFLLHAPPESGITFPDEIVRARLSGHFDDPAASTCRYAATPEETWQAPGPAEQILLCREAFVVDTMQILEVIGTPPAA